MIWSTTKLHILSDPTQEPPTQDTFTCTGSPGATVPSSLASHPRTSPLSPLSSNFQCYIGWPASHAESDSERQVDVKRDQRTEGRGFFSPISQIPLASQPHLVGVHNLQLVGPHPTNENTAPLSPEFDPHWTHNPAQAHEPQIWERDTLPPWCG